MIGIGKVVYQILSLTVGKEIDGQIYPLIANLDATFPFVVYRRSNLNQLESKDKPFQESCNVEIVIASDKYSESLRLAEEVRSAMTSSKGRISEYNIRSIEMIDAEEDYMEETFLQKITFKITINNGQ